MAGIFAKTPYLIYPKDQLRTERLWETFNVKGFEAASLNNPYEKMLFEEWTRCKKLGIDPTMHEAAVLSEEQFLSLLDLRAFLLETAQPVLKRVEKTLTGLSGILILTDQEGTILHISGDPKVRLRAADYKLVEGGQWSESISGTNGIGTAIAKKAPVHVHSSEHFCEGWHIWTCAGAPILDPLSGDVLGVVDFTAFESNFQPGAMNLSASVAATISQEIRVQLEVERLQLFNHYSQYSARFPGEVVLIYDRQGRLVRHTPGINPADYGVDAHDLSVFSANPDKVEPLYSSTAKSPIGTVVVTPSSSASPGGLWLPGQEENGGAVKPS